ncbi:MAG: SDR family oxidoreductase [Candidatus Riflebacteria bacterium]|nr:SDR family oxidoreductase [Candidatus Riflebacteria bacterium]
MRLQGRVALVTGASRGVGRAVSLALAREGCDLVLVAKTVEPDPRLPGTLNDTRREVEALGRRALVVRTDVRFEDQILAAVARANQELGHVDILINNAGALFLGPVVETPAKRFDLVVGINARAPFLLAQAVLPGMVERRWGHIVNMSPPLKPESAPGKVAYMISKFGMTLLTHGLAAEVRQHNVAVNSLWPVCVVETQAVIHFGFGDRDRWRRPEILADAVVALCGRDPSERTGRAWLDEEVLAADGITDLSGYACVPGREPLKLEW